MANGIGPAFWGDANGAIDAIDYTTAAILVWVNANGEDAARTIMENNSSFAGLLSVDEIGPTLFLFTFEGAENA